MDAEALLDLILAAVAFVGCYTAEQERKHRVALAAALRRAPRIDLLQPGGLDEAVNKGFAAPGELVVATGIVDASARSYLSPLVARTNDVAAVVRQETLTRTRRAGGLHVVPAVTLSSCEWGLTDSRLIPASAPRLRSMVSDAGSAGAAAASAGASASAAVVAGAGGAAAVVPLAVPPAELLRRSGRPFITVARGKDSLESLCRPASWEPQTAGSDRLLDLVPSHNPDKRPSPARVGWWTWTTEFLLHGILHRDTVDVEAMLPLGIVASVIGTAEVSNGQLSLRAHSEFGGWLCRRSVDLIAAQYDARATALRRVSIVFVAAGALLLVPVGIAAYQWITGPTTQHQQQQRNHVGGGNGGDDHHGFDAGSYNSGDFEEDDDDDDHDDDEDPHHHHGGLTSFASGSHMTLDGADAPAASPSEECVACAERRIATVLTPCGHMCLCITCTNRILTGDFAQRRCPLCRTHFAANTVVRVFAAGSDFGAAAGAATGGAGTSSSAAAAGAAGGGNPFAAPPSAGGNPFASS